MKTKKEVDVKKLSLEVPLTESDIRRALNIKITKKEILEIKSLGEALYINCEYLGFWLRRFFKKKCIEIFWYEYNHADTTEKVLSLSEYSRNFLPNKLYFLVNKKANELLNKKLQSAGDDIEALIEILVMIQYNKNFPEIRKNVLLKIASLKSLK